MARLIQLIGLIAIALIAQNAYSQETIIWDEKPNYSYLEKVGKIYEQKHFRGKCRTTITVKAQGEYSAKMIVESTIIAKKPNKLAIDSRFVRSDGKQGPVYKLASNGKYLYFHRPGLKQYSRERFSQITPRGDMFLLTGITGIIYLESLIPDVLNKKKDKEDDSFLKNLKGGSHAETDGVEYYVYETNFPGREMQMRFYVRKKSFAIDRFEVFGNDGKLKIRFVEKVLLVENPTEFSADAFQFRPSKGTRRVSKVPIETDLVDISYQTQ